MENVKNMSSKRGRGRQIGMGIMLVLGIVIGWYGIGRLISPWTVITVTTFPTTAPSPSSDTSMAALRVGCYNIAHGRGGRFEATNWDGGNRVEKVARMHQIAHLLNEAQLDIVVLNEVDFSSVWSGHTNQAHLIAKEAGYPYCVEQRNFNVAIPFLSLKFGNAILSKYPLTDIQFLDYPNTSAVMELGLGGFKEGVIVTVTLPDRSRLQVAAIHFDVHSESVRIASAQMLLDHHRQSGLPLLMMGDFNTAPTGYPQHHADENRQNTIEILLDSQQVTTILPGLPIPQNAFTFPSDNPARVIDWIFVSNPWRIEEQKVLATNLSDHLPVTALLTREPIHEHP